jgi:hypothetical protein
MSKFDFKGFSGGRTGLLETFVTVLRKDDLPEKSI